MKVPLFGRWKRAERAGSEAAAEPDLAAAPEPIPASEPAPNSKPAKAHIPGQLGWSAAAPRDELQGVPTAELVGELVDRFERGEDFGGDDTRIWNAGLLQEWLAQRLNVHANRFSVRRQRDLSALLFRDAERFGADARDATIVELGSGALHPFGVLFTLQLMGARRGIAVDMDAPGDWSRSCRALANLVHCALVDPEALFDRVVSPEDVLANLSGHDVQRLARGQVEGLDGARLQYVQRSIFDLGSLSGQADHVVSNAFLEHLPRFEEVVARLRSLSRPGGLQVHNIDFTDHRRYTSDVHPLAFLAIEGEEELCHGSNRLRWHEVERHFRAGGFEVLDVRVQDRAKIDDAMRKTLAPRFAAMSREQLEPMFVVATLRAR